MHFDTSHQLSLQGAILQIVTPLRLIILLLSLSVEGSAQLPETVVASVNGTAITQQQVDDLVATQIYPLQQQLYAIRRVALENLIVTKLLEAEALKRGVSRESLRQQLTVGEVVVTSAQVEDTYKKNASYFASMSPDEAKERLRLDLESQARMKHYRTALDELRKSSLVSIVLEQPTLPGLDDGKSPAQGAVNPLVTIVEFSDFECPYCREVQPTLKQVMSSYGENVRLVFKHLPLEGHRHAFSASRAAYCAGEQEKFWQFHDALFASSDLSPDSTNKLATQVGLDQTKFQSCLNSEHSKAAIAKDLATAQRLRIDATPGFVINGKVHSGALSFTALQQLIERELSLRNRPNNSSAN